MNTSSRGMKFATIWRAIALTLILGLPPMIKAEGKAPGEYDVKAAFLYNFSAFTEWPATAFETPTSPIVVGVVGKDPFGSALDAMMKGERVKDRPLIVWRVTRPEDMSRCHILFISDSETKQLGEILSRLKSQPVLTVSDIPGFAELGGAVGFTTAGSVQLSINPAAVQSAHLAMSAKLLRLARLVEEKETVR